MSKLPYSVTKYWTLRWFVWDFISAKIRLSLEGKSLSRVTASHKSFARSNHFGKLAKERLVFLLRWFREDKKRILVAVLIIIILWPGRHAIIYAEPGTYAPAPKIVHVKDVQPLQQVSKPEKAEVALIAVAPPPAPPVAPKPVVGCGSNPYMALIYQHESGCNTASVNSIGCRGLGQACPGSKLPCSSSDWNCQNNFFVAYANAVYGSPAAAWAAWQIKHWW